MISDSAVTLFINTAQLLQRSLDMEEAPTSTIKRWIRRKVLSDSIINYYGYDALLKFVECNFTGKDRHTKQAVTFFLRQTLPLSQFTDEYAKQIYLELRLKVNGYKTAAKEQEYLKIYGIDALKEKRKENAARTLRGRVRNLANGEETTPEEFEKLKKDSYTKAIITKGKNVAKKLGIEENLNDDEYSKLSGFTKKRNFSCKTTEEKTAYKIDWKRKNLSNSNVRKIIISEHPEFMLIDVNNLDSDDVNRWYAAYRSVMSVCRLKKQQDVSSQRLNYKTGFYFSTKTNVQHYYRSSYELVVMMFLDRYENCTLFESEPYHITLGNLKRYVPDLVVTFTNGNVKIIEIKPDYKISNFMSDKGNLVKEILGSKFMVLPTSIISKEELLCEFFNDIGE